MSQGEGVMSVCIYERTELPRPKCTCGAGDDAPVSAHRMGWTRWMTLCAPVGIEIENAACDLYVWHKFCGRSKVSEYQCPYRECGRKIAYCDRHGGETRVVEEMVEHLRIAH